MTRITSKVSQTPARRAEQELVASFSSGPGNVRCSHTEATIDNSKLAYTAIRLRRSRVRVHCRPNVLATCPGVLVDLDADLLQCLEILPTNLHALIRRTQVWINDAYCYGPQHKPVVLNHSTAHHHEGWLLWARDRPEKALGIEIYNCFDYQRMRLHWNGCGLILHELCHLIHQQVLPDGLDNTSVKDAFGRATRSGLYETVLRRDWAGKDLDCDLAYAMVDHKEFFAELSVSYWSKGYTELDGANRSRMECCSPPLQEPNVLTRIQQRQTAHLYHQLSKAAPDRPVEGPIRGLDLSAMLNLAAQAGHQTTERQHCNKFYPFTRGQLRFLDAESFEALEDIWSDISEWEDPNNIPVCLRPIHCWSPWKGGHDHDVVSSATVIADTVVL